jgi:ornithine--oxo-acid transaminase
MVDENLVQHAAEMGDYLMDCLFEINSPYVDHYRGKGLLVGIVLKPESGGARRFCEALQLRGVLTKETHEVVIRLAPPLIIKKNELDWAMRQIAEVLCEA